MKQRHSYSKLTYHIVMETKNREPYIVSETDEQLLRKYISIKAKELDSYLLEFGTWYEHAHLVLRARPVIALSKLYGQIKGYSTAMWRKTQAGRPFQWGDGVFIETIDFDNLVPLRNYIQNQRKHHADKSFIRRWEAGLF